MTIKQQGGIFGRNPSFNDVDINTASVSGSLTANLIGIGTSPTSGALQIASGLSSTAFLENTSSAYCFVGLKDTTGNLSYFGSANGEFKIQTAGSGYADKLKVSSVGDVTVGLGNLVIGTSGKGIDFSATSGTGTSELFDDYEEGVYTPTGNGITFSAATGTYTKIGNSVRIIAEVTFPSTANTSYAEIQGLPFTSAAELTPTAIWSNHASGIYALVLPSSTSVRLYSNAGAAFDNVNLSTESVKISVFYKV